MPNTRSGPDLLRQEYFGALYYSRRTASYTAIRPDLAELLYASAKDGANLFDLYVANPGRVRLSELKLVELVARWQRKGILDASYRCPAQLIEADRSHGALIGPLVTNVQLTRACNLRCTHCYVNITPKRDPKELTTEQLGSLFDELGSVGANIVVLAGGEPMIRPDFWALIDRVGQAGLDAALCTNATLIKPENARRLVASPIRWYSISLDGPDAETHDFLRGKGRFNHAARGIRHLLEAGADDLKIRVTVTPHNLDRMVDFAPTARDLGVHSVAFKPFRHTPTGAGACSHHLILDRTSYLKAIKAAAAAWPKDAPPATFSGGMPKGPPDWTRVIPTFGCVGGTTAASVMYDGRVVACDAVLVPGDWSLHERTFAECWRKAPTLTSWRQLEGNDTCRSCSMHSVCRGGCRARALAGGWSINEPDPWSYCTEREEVETGIAVSCAS